MKLASILFQAHFAVVFVKRRQVISYFTLRLAVVVFMYVCNRLTGLCVFTMKSALYQGFQCCQYLFRSCSANLERDQCLDIYT